MRFRRRGGSGFLFKATFGHDHKVSKQDRDDAHPGRGKDVHNGMLLDKYGGKHHQHSVDGADDFDQQVAFETFGTDQAHRDDDR